MGNFVVEIVFFIMRGTSIMKQAKTIFIIIAAALLAVTAGCGKTAQPKTLE